MPYDPLPVGYRTSSTAIATYPYSEIADGTGTTLFMGCKASVDATLANDILFLTTQTIVPNYQNYTDLVSDTYVYFEVAFLNPKIIEGFCYLSFPITCVSTSTSTTVTPYAKIIHYDGSSETEMVAETAMTPVTRSGGGTSYFDITGKFVIPRTKFKTGETLRAYFKAVLTGLNVESDLYHDPTGSATNFTESGGKMKALVPFILDI